MAEQEILLTFHKRLVIFDHIGVFQLQEKGKEHQHQQEVVGAVLR